MTHKVMQQALDALEIHAEYDDTYPPHTRPLNDCAFAAVAIRAELEKFEAKIGLIKYTKKRHDGLKMIESGERPAAGIWAVLEKCGAICWDKQFKKFAITNTGSDLLKKWNSK